jgi:hypothetical protein
MQHIVAHMIVLYSCRMDNVASVLMITLKIHHIITSVFVVIVH